MSSRSETGNRRAGHSRVAAGQVEAAAGPAAHAVLGALVHVLLAARAAPLCGTIDYNINTIFTIKFPNEIYLQCPSHRGDTDTTSDVTPKKNYNLKP